MRDRLMEIATTTRPVSVAAALTSAEQKLAHVAVTTLI